MYRIFMYIFYYALALYGGIKSYKFNKRQNFEDGKGRLVPIGSKESIIILINFLIIGIHAIFIFNNLLSDKLLILRVFNSTLSIYLWIWIIVEYKKYKRSSKKRYFISAIMSLLILGAILGYMGYIRWNLEEYIMYTEINSIKEKDIYLYENKLDKNFKSQHSGILKYKNDEYRYYWNTEDDQKKNPPILEIKNKGENEELHITFEDNSYNKRDKLYSIIDLNTGERLDRYESDIYLEVEGEPVAISQDYSNDIGIESKLDTGKLEVIYLEKIKEYDYFIIRNNNDEKNFSNFLVRTEFGRVQNIVELPKGAIYKDYKTSPYEMYMAINFAREGNKGTIKNSISIIELQDHDHTKLLTGQMNNELNVGEFSYFISEYEFVDNRKFLVIKPNSETIYFELDPQKNHLDDLNLDKSE